MPEINSDKVCFVIVKAREFDVQVEGQEATTPTPRTIILRASSHPEGTTASAGS